MFERQVRSRERGPTEFEISLTPRFARPRLAPGRDNTPTPTAPPRTSSMAKDAHRAPLPTPGGGRGNKDRGVIIGSVDCPPLLGRRLTPAQGLRGHLHARSRELRQGQACGPTLSRCRERSADAPEEIVAKHTLTGLKVALKFLSKRKISTSEMSNRVHREVRCGLATWSVQSPEAGTSSAAGTHGRARLR